jgi:hypothetical protein
VIVLFVYDRSTRSVNALTELVAAVARSQSEGMFVDVQRRVVDATDASDEPVPAVFVDGIPVASPTRRAIYEAIVRANRRRSSVPADGIPRARLRR